MANVARTCTSCGHYWRETRGTAAGCRCACHRLIQNGS